MFIVFEYFFLRILVAANIFVLVKFIEVGYEITYFLCSLVLESLAGLQRSNLEGALKLHPWDLHQLLESK
jgi:hypothetical protein